MPKYGKFQKKKLEREEIKAVEFYKQGFTYREVGKMVGKSYTWVYFAVKKHLSTDTKLDKEKQK